jgi:hypothetical protein
MATLARLSAVVLIAVSSFAASAVDLYNNTNTGAVSNKPTIQTTFLTPGATHITQLVTYHWNNGRGAPPGTIALKSLSGPTYGPFKAQGTSGSNNAQNVNWVADVNITVPIGTYQIVDSDPNTWSQNAQTHGAGFAIIRGEHLPVGTVAPASPATPTPPATSVSRLPPAAMPPAPSPVVPIAKPVPPVTVPKPLPAPVTAPALKPLPSPAPAPSSAAFKPCSVNAGSIAAISPCAGAPGTKIAIKLSRALKSPLKEIVFKPYQVSGIAGATGAQVIAAVSGGATAAGSIYEVDAPRQLCIGTGGSWDLFPVDAANASQGDIGRFTVDCRAGVAPVTSGVPAPTPAPAPPPVAATPFKPCFTNAGSIASSSPCNAHAGDVVTVRLSRALKTPLAKIVFKPYSVTGIPGGVGAEVIVALSGSGLAAGSNYTLSAPRQLCLAGTGSWDLFPVDAKGAAQGDIGRLTVQCN